MSNGDTGYFKEGVVGDGDIRAALNMIRVSSWQSRGIKERVGASPAIRSHRQYSMISQTALHQAARMRCHGCHISRDMYIARTQHKHVAQKLPKRELAPLWRVQGGAGLGSPSGADRDASVPF